ncbi:MAG: hypothetical protein V3S55_09490 [Nitrospiraceae bacterium]
MATQLIGAKGDRIMEIESSSGRVQTQAVTESDMEDRNENGFAWALPFDAIDPTGADDKFVYIQNTESDLNLHIRRIHVSTTVVGFLEVLRVTGTAAGGSGVTLVNFNEGFATKTPTGIFETGSDITALTDAGKYAFQQLTVADTTYEITFHHDIILNKNGAIALNWVPATGILTGTVYFFLHE